MYREGQKRGGQAAFFPMCEGVSKTLPGPK